MKEEEKSIREEEKSKLNSSSSLGANDDRAKKDTYEAPVTSSSSSSLSGNMTKSEWGACRTEAWQCFSSNMEVRFLSTSLLERFCLLVTTFLFEVHRIHL